MDGTAIAWRAFELLWPLAGGAIASVFMLRRRQRISREETAKGHLAKLRHEAVAKCLAGVGELYGLDIALPRETEEQRAAYLARVAEPLRAVAAHEFMLPPDLRREVMALVACTRAGDNVFDGWRDQADQLCCAVDSYLPPIERAPSRGS